MTRPSWTSADIAGDLHTRREHEVLAHMVDACGDPLPRFSAWTPKQALARCRNIGAELERAYAHGTGAAK